MMQQHTLSSYRLLYSPGKPDAMLSAAAKWQHSDMTWHFWSYIKPTLDDEHNGSIRPRSSQSTGDKYT